MGAFGSEGQAVWMGTPLHGGLEYRIETRNVSILRVLKMLMEEGMWGWSDLSTT